MVGIILGLLLGILIGIEYGEELSLRAQIAKEEVLLFSDVINEMKKIPEILYTDEELRLACESISEINYQTGTYFEKLVEEDEVKTWQEEMEDDLSFYCPMIVIGRIISRIEEIIEESK